MLKWLHRGVISILLLIAASAATGLVADCNETIMANQQGTDPSSAEGVTRMQFRVSDRTLQFASMREFCDATTESTFLEIDRAGVSVVYAVGDDSDGCLGRENGLVELLEINLPLWFIVGIAAPYPCIVLYRLTQKWRHRPGTQAPCRSCSYDLTGNESGICPECGEAVEVGV